MTLKNRVVKRSVFCIIQKNIKWEYAVKGLKNGNMRDTIIIPHKIENE